MLLQVGGMTLFLTENSQISHSNKLIFEKTYLPIYISQILLCKTLSKKNFPKSHPDEI